jgi:hypothetical protein
MLIRRRAIGSRYDAAHICAFGRRAAAEPRQIARIEQCERSAIRQTIDGNLIALAEAASRRATSLPIRYAAGSGPTGECLIPSNTWETTALRGNSVARRGNSKARFRVVGYRHRFDRGYCLSK